MALLPAKCPECGGFVEVDSEKKLGICQHCGQPFVVEDAIQTFNNYYNTTNNYNTTHNYGDGAVVNVFENQNSVSALMQRAFLFLEDGDFKQAYEYFDKVLDIEPEFGEAYLGKLMAELQVRKREDLKNYSQPFDERNNYRKAIRFGDDNLISELQSYSTYVHKKAIYAEATSLISKATAEADIDKAIALLEQCSDYLDSGELIATAKQKFLNKLERVNSLVSDYRNFHAQKQGVSRESQLRTSLSKLNSEKTQLEYAKNNFSEITRKLDSNEFEINTKNEKIKYLQSEKTGLGIFSSKRKKEIDSELSTLQNEVANLNNEVTQLKNNLCGFTDISEITNRINTINASFSQSEEELKSLNAKSTGLSSPGEIIAELESIGLLTEAAIKVINHHNMDKSYIKFGSYIQNNGKDAIEWLVLARDGKNVLITSKYALDCQPYNKENEVVTWETCSLRKWLNNTFLNSAFTTEEQKQIVITNVTVDKNSTYITTTQDKIFLLSTTEAQKHFSSDSKRQCLPTTYAKSKGAFVGVQYADNTWFWLRSVNDNHCCAGVGASGEIGGNLFTDANAVRPAMWISLEI